MDFQQIRKYVKGVLTNSFLNKTTLDKLSTSDAGNLLFDGKEINGGGSSQIAYGGIDTSNVIYELTSSVEGTEWVATEDCYFIGSLVGGDNSASTYYIDGVVVGSQYSSSTIISCYFPILLLKGQTVKCKAMNSNYIRTVKFYGVKKSENILHEYSTEEKVVGKWVDGKPLYEKTVYFGSGTLSNKASVSFENMNIDKIMVISGTFEDTIEGQLSIPVSLDGTFYVGFYCNRRAILLTFNGAFNGRISNAYAIIQYTKTTD